jgi:hypothetical protein
VAGAHLVPALPRPDLPPPDLAARPAAAWRLNWDLAAATVAGGSGSGTPKLKRMNSHQIHKHLHSFKAMSGLHFADPGIPLRSSANWPRPPVHHSLGVSSSILSLQSCTPWVAPGSSQQTRRLSVGLEPTFLVAIVAGPVKILCFFNAAFSPPVRLRSDEGTSQSYLAVRSPALGLVSAI